MAEAGNALAHGAKDQPVQVAIETDEVSVLLQVKNRGTPIPAELLPVLFEPFHRGPSSEGRAAGLGLGLYIVHQIVLAHSGTLTVSSSAEAGTTFSVQLPRHASAP